MAFSIGYKIEFLNRFSAVGVKLNKAFNAIGRNAKKATDKLRGFNNRLGASDRKAKKATMTFEKLRNELLSIAAAGFAISLPIRQAIEFESAMSDVRKVVDFDSPKQFKEFGKDILNLSKTIPLTAIELSKIAAAGGQFGIKAAGLPAFIKDVSKASVAWDISSRDAGESIAKMANVLQTPINKINETSDAINHLSNNMAHNAAQLLEVTVRAGSTGKQFGLTNNQITAMGSSLLALGIRQERAGTTMDIMFRNLLKFSKSDSLFRKDYLKSPQLAINNLIKRFAAIKDPIKKSSAIIDAVGAEGARGLNKLVGSMAVYDKSLSLVSDKTKILGSVQEEYNIRLGTTGNKLKLLKNNATLASVAFGDALLPAVNVIAGALILMLAPVTQLLNDYPILAQVIGFAAAAFIIAKIAALLYAGSLAFVIKTTKILTLQTLLSSKAVVGMGGALGKLGKFGALVALAALIASIVFMLKQSKKFLNEIKGQSLNEVGKNLKIGLSEMVSPTDPAKIMADAQAKAAAKFGTPEMQEKINRLTSSNASQNFVEKKSQGNVNGSITVSAAKGTQVDSAEMSNAGFMRDIGFNLPFAGAGA